MLRRLTRLPTPTRTQRWRGLRCVAAVNADNNLKTAVDDCLERVLGPGSGPGPGAKPASAFAVVFFEGHEQSGVQDALHSFAERWPQAPPVIGCALGESPYELQKRRLKQQQSARRLELASSSPSGKPGQKLTPGSASEGSSSPLPNLSDSSFRSPKIVTVLGLSFEGDKEGKGGGSDGGEEQGHVEALPLYAEGGCFPNILGKDSVLRVFQLPKEKQPLFFMLSKDDQAVPASDLQDTQERLANLLPDCTRLCALSSGDPSSVVSSFPSGDAPVVGVCLVGDVSLQEQAGLARKTLGAFGFNAITVTGDVCDELFVPSQPAPAKRDLLGNTPASALTEMDTLERVQERLRALAEQEQQEKEQQQQQLGVFKVDEVVFPGMTRRFRIFEPRYRALVKQCLAEDAPLVTLPLSKGGNTVATAARVSGLYNVEEDGSCEVEITGIARCNVKTMWMKGESFGLFEAVVELFGDEEQEEEHQGTVPKRPRGETADRAPETSERGTAATEEGDEEIDGVEGDDGGEGQGLMAELSEVERLRIEVSAILQKELYRTRTQGRSPLWPGWDGYVSQNDARAAFTMLTPPKRPTPPPANPLAADKDGEKGDEHASRESSSSGGGGAGGTDSAGSESGGTSSDSIGGVTADRGGSREGREGAAAAAAAGGGGGEGRGRASFDGRSGISGMDPCDLDAEALSYWAAQNLEAGTLMKHGWLATTSTTERLRGVRDLCRFALARHRDRSGVDGSVLARPLSALRDLTSR